jgi:2-polyprenyl-6-hydroxyphenyl methylase/3-demethylubiquinone-9 3-methyltransferase
MHMAPLSFLGGGFRFGSSLGRSSLVKSLKSSNKLLITSSVDEMEMNQFSRHKEWWNPLGPYALLMKMNPIRISYITNAIQQQQSVKQLEVLDIGCGGTPNDSISYIS